MRAWMKVALLVGGLMLSRGVEDDTTAEDILRGCREAARHIGEA